MSVTVVSKKVVHAVVWRQSHFKPLQWLQCVSIINSSKGIRTMDGCDAVHRTIDGCDAVHRTMDGCDALDGCDDL